MGRLRAFEDAVENYPGLRLDGVVRRDGWDTPRLRVINRERGIAFLVDLKKIIGGEVLNLARQLYTGVYGDGITLAHEGPELTIENYAKQRNNLLRNFGSKGL